MAEPSTIGADCTVRGTLRGSAALDVEGTVVGRIEGPEGLTVAAGARVDAEVQAGHAHLAGELSGQVQAQRVEVKAGAKVQGEVETDTLSIEEGATVRFETRMKLDLPPDAEG
jgi:cytoskeletal protein CcmA (bactofilin family)